MDRQSADIGTADALRMSGRRGRRPLKQIEMLPVRPRGDVGLLRLCHGLLAAAGNLGLLDMRIVVHEGLAEAGAETGILAQPRQRLVERRR
jgi:hypothetical protein